MFPHVFLWCDQRRLCCLNEFYENKVYFKTNLQLLPVDLFESIWTTSLIDQLIDCLISVCKVIEV